MSAAITAAVITVGGGLVMANQARQAAKGAAGAQTAAAQGGIDEERRQFDAIQALLKPFITGGTGAFTAQQNLIGLGGPEAQAKMLAELQASPEFKAITDQGENAILSNASATGGLRGGNVQAALAQFRPRVLSQLIEQRFGQLGTIAGMGQASATGQAAMGMQQGQNIAGLLGQIGQAQAGGILGGARADMLGTNAILSGVGAYGHSQGWKGF